MIETISDQEFFSSILNTLQQKQFDLFSQLIIQIPTLSKNRLLYLVRETLSRWNDFGKFSQLGRSNWLQFAYIHLYQLKNCEIKQDILKRLHTTIESELTANRFGYERSSRYNWKIKLNSRFVKLFSINQTQLIKEYLNKTKSEDYGSGCWGKSEDDAIVGVKLKLILNHCSLETVISLFNSRRLEWNFNHFEVRSFTEYFINNSCTDQLKLLVCQKANNDGTNSYRLKALKKLIEILPLNDLVSFVAQIWNELSFTVACRKTTLEYIKQNHNETYQSIKNQLFEIPSKYSKIKKFVQEYD